MSYTDHGDDKFKSATINLRTDDKNNWDVRVVLKRA
jgi:hypothetical protein